MRVHDNRNMSDMETMYVARIEAMQRELTIKQHLIDSLRSDVEYAELQLTRVLGQERTA